MESSQRVGKNTNGESRDYAPPFPPTSLPIAALTGASPAPLDLFLPLPLPLGVTGCGPPVAAIEDHGNRGPCPHVLVSHRKPLGTYERCVCVHLRPSLNLLSRASEVCFKKV
ncbi:hypothetical protein NDU88_001658 [Pleurodeles waltl]|uniref:Uncharacterized protein n=1 Tax=Pleurodeles waltl TaxID=8319 RepID=A0AAV7VZK6_PLEWA|nr:hypothetical protein NDU88_001658 [Pleurodeles waltl]